jgi:hypothetical protein
MFVSLFKTYPLFLIMPSKENPQPDNYFDTDAFLADSSDSVLSFMRSFTQSQLFHSFVQDRIARQCEDEEEKDLFDEYIEEAMKRLSLKLSILASSTKKGFLFKCGQMRKSWKRRFFVVRDSEISYYTDQTLANSKGKLQIFPGESKVIVPDKCPRDGAPNAHFFVLDSKGRSLVCCADSAEDRREWVRLLRAKAMDERSREALVQRTSAMIPEQSRRLIQVREEPFLQSAKIFQLLVAGAASTNTSMNSGTPGVISPTDPRSSSHYYASGGMSGVPPGSYASPQTSGSAGSNFQPGPGVAGSSSGGRRMTMTRMPSQGTPDQHHMGGSSQPLGHQHSSGSLQNLPPHGTSPQSWDSSASSKLQNIVLSSFEHNDDYLSSEDEDDDSNDFSEGRSNSNAVDDEDEPFF